MMNTLDSLNIFLLIVWIVFLCLVAFSLLEIMLSEKIKLYRLSILPAYKVSSIWPCYKIESFSLQFFFVISGEGKYQYFNLTWTSIPSLHGERAC